MARGVQITFDCADPAGNVLDHGPRLPAGGPPEGFDSREQALDAIGVPPENRNDASAAPATS